MSTLTIRPNRLHEADSPYLLQHADNPVHWFMWGEEALQKARELDRPIFLSIGYSTCHWCHVMAHESFEDDEIADILNKRYIPIKVDREERPDIDMIYVNACLAATGSAGWPLTAICTPEGRPFFLGTYFPPRRKRGMPGLLEILTTICEHWKKSRSQAETAALDIMAAAQPRINLTSEDPSLSHLIQRAIDGLKAAFDPEYGGFGHAPKFPTPTNLLFLMRQWEKTRDQELRRMIETTLTCMYRGGIFDHIGYGFHRYATDRQWLIPHFEKMLYDNALLALAYIEAFQAFGEPLYRSIAQKIFRYILRDMQHPDGGFYAAEDADSEGEEGRFYLWTKGEILHALPSPIGEQFCQVYDITEEGNFSGGSIPNLVKASREQVQDFAEMQPWLEELQRRRTYRERPSLDDKIITSWNGLMVAALARGYRVFGDQNLLQAARAAVQFILENLVDGEGRLYATFRKRRGVHGFLDDYAFLSFGLLELYEACQDDQYLELAEHFMADLIELFEDKNGAGLFFTSPHINDLPIRPKSFEDGALPSGTAIAIYNIVKLASHRPDITWENALSRLTRASVPSAEGEPWHYPALLMALASAHERPMEITFVGDLESDVFADLWAAVNSHYLPDAVVKFEPGPSNGQCSVQVCLNQRCLTPTSNPDHLLEILDTKKASV